MSKTFKFEILTPEKNFYSEDVSMVVFNTHDGEMGIMADHMPIVCAINIGVIKIKDKDDKEEVASVGEGFVKVTKNKVIAIVDSAEWPEEIDVERAKKAKEKAELMLRDEKNEKEMKLMLVAAIQRANTRIKTAQK